RSPGVARALAQRVLSALAVAGAELVRGLPEPPATRDAPAGVLLVHALVHDAIGLEALCAAADAAPGAAASTAPDAADAAPAGHAGARERPAAPAAELAAAWE